MHEKIAKIENTFLGREDHGIWTAQLQVSYGSTCQGIGGYTLDEPRKDGDDKHIGRFGTSYGMEWIMRCVDACGVDRWEQVKGRTVLVYFEEDSWGAQPIGMGPLPTEPGKPFMFSALSEEQGLPS
jgi:hypothetical protein